MTFRAPHRPSDVHQHLDSYRPFLNLLYGEKPCITGR
jgi:hypothetical protein